MPLSTRLHPAPCRRSIDSRSSGVTTRSVQEPEHHRRPRRNRVSPSGGEYDVSKEQGSGRDRGSSALTETKSRAAHESELFDWLAENSGVDKKVSLNCFQDEGHRGLAVNQDVEYGEVSLFLSFPSPALSCNQLRLCYLWRCQLNLLLSGYPVCSVCVVCPSIICIQM